MVQKIAVILLLFLIIYQLGVAAYRLLVERDTGFGTVKALATRVGLSLFLFLGLMVLFAKGVWSPHGLPDIPSPHAPTAPPPEGPLMPPNVEAP